MRVIILDSEGVTLFRGDMPDDCRWNGIQLAIPPSRKEMFSALSNPSEITPLSIRQARAVFEQYRDDGVAVFRRHEA